MSSLAYTYKFYIAAYTKGDVVFYQEASIVTINNCLYDKVLIKSLLPNNLEDHYKLFKLVNNYPVLVINQFAT